jgi:hypothetical protein
MKIAPVGISWCPLLYDGAALRHCCRLLYEIEVAAAAGLELSIRMLGRARQECGLKHRADNETRTITHRPGPGPANPRPHQEVRHDPRRADLPDGGDEGDGDTEQAS